jgi:hypothetical protein
MPFSHRWCYAIVLWWDTIAFHISPCHPRITDRPVIILGITGYGHSGYDAVTYVRMAPFQHEVCAGVCGTQSRRHESLSESRKWGGRTCWPILHAVHNNKNRTSG